MEDNKQPDAASLGRAIKQLEALLETRTREEQAQQPQPGDDRNLPVLDDVIDPEAEDSVDLSKFESLVSTTEYTTRADAEQVRQALQRLSEQMEVELEALVSILKESMLYEFRRELASALGIDPQQLETIDKDDNIADS